MVLFLALFSFSQAYGYGYDGIHWFLPNPMGESYLINPNCADPEAGTQAEQIAAISNGANTWNTQGKAKFSFIYGGTTTKTLPDDSHVSSYNDYNEIMFVQDPDYWLFKESPAVCAVTFVWYYTYTKEIFECDMAFNDINFIWNGVGQPTIQEVDIWNEATHEFGHFLMLNDLYNTSDSEKTMYWMAAKGESKKRDLDPDDIAGIQYIYGVRYKCGDANGDDQVNVTDVIYLINYLFKGGPAPVNMGAADVDGNGSLNVGDVIYLINYLFKGGPAPKCQ